MEQFLTFISANKVFPLNSNDWKSSRNEIPRGESSVYSFNQANHFSAWSKLS